MDGAEIEKLTELESTHWWYAERRSVLRHLVRDLSASNALDIGAAGGGNTRVLSSAGWSATAIEHSAVGAQVAGDRGLSVVRGDARRLPFATGVFGLVVAFDVLEHIEEDDQMAAEIARVLQPSGTALITVPADMKLWSAHDVAVGHVRRYQRAELQSVLEGAGLQVTDLWSWNVLLRPAVKMRRNRTSGSDLGEVNPLLNAILRGAVAAERYLPVGRLPGVSLVARARRRH